MCVLKFKILKISFEFDGVFFLVLNCVQCRGGLQHEIVIHKFNAVEIF